MQKKVLIKKLGRVVKGYPNPSLCLSSQFYWFPALSKKNNNQLYYNYICIFIKNITFYKRQI